MFDINLYNDEFFEWHKKYVHESSVECGKMLKKYFKITSVVDMGCGIGSFLEGIGLGKGYDIGHGEKYSNVDIDFGVDIFKVKVKKYQVCICLEVAEHVEEKNSEKLVDILTGSAKEWIIFSGATVGQEGTGHINCQPKEYWIELFKKKGWELDKCTEEIKDKWKGAEYYKKNIMIYANNN